MNNPEALRSDEKVLNDLDFDSYTDPVAHAIEGMHQASELWSAQMHGARYRVGGRTREKADSKVARSKADYLQSFTAAARTVAMHSPTPEQAITALGIVTHEDEAHRLQAVSTWYTVQGLNPSSEAYHRHIVMAFADPKGETIMPDSTEQVMNEEAAIANYAARLDEHERAILGYNTKVDDKSTLAKIGTTALGGGMLALGGVMKFLNKK